MVSFHWILLSLLVFTVSVESVKTRFRFFGTIYCKFPFALKDDFIFDFEVKEWDPWTKNDNIGLKETLNLTRILPMSEQTIAYSIEAEDDGDGPQITKKYEIYFRVKHDCNAGGKKIWKKVEIGKHFEIVDGVHTHEEHFSVTNYSVQSIWGKKRNSIQRKKK